MVTCEEAESLDAATEAPLAPFVVCEHADRSKGARGDRPLRSFWAGQAISQLGDRISELTIPLIAVSVLQASAWQVSWLTALVWTPNPLAPWLGSWIDQHRWQRRVLVFADLLRAAASCSLPSTSTASTPRSLRPA